jgi:two-component system, chemotaxis family, CheB/CheR fusion protein
MSIHAISRVLLARRNRLQWLAQNHGQGDVKLAVEEIAAMIEELEAANEELQSANEELHSANHELEDKNKSLARLNTDLQHLFDNVDAAVLFVDQESRVTRFTPAAAHIFPLRQNDCGRRLTDFTSKLRGVDLVADLNTVSRTGEGIEREVKVEADQKARAMLMRVRPYRTAGSNLDGMVLSFFDIDAISIASQTETARYAALSRASGDAILGLSLDGIVNAWSPGAERLLGYSAEEMNRKHISILAPEGLEPEQRALLEQVRSGKEVAPYDSVRRQKNGSLVLVSIRAAPILSQDAAPIGISETMRDISERKRAEERNALLTRELAHRTGNLLAIVHSTMVQSAQYSKNKEHFIQSVDDRLRSMWQAHDLLIANNFKGAPVSELVRTSLKPFLVNEASLEMHGPPVTVEAGVVHSLSLVLHELATNALKYGALTRPSGRVIVSWELDGPEVKSPRFRISWREVDGPPVVPPKHIGFGTEVISAAPKHELGAEVSLDYHPTGLVWNLDMPADQAIYVVN